MGDLALEVSGLWEAYRRRAKLSGTKRHDARWALQDVDVTVARGEAVAFIGGNGSGKSTLLRVLAGILRPSRGTVWSLAPVGAVIDLPLGADRELSANEFLDVTGCLHGLNRQQIRDGREEIVAFSGLSAEAMAEPMRTFSAGMVVRLEMAVMLHVKPKVIVLDEVLAASDDHFQRACVGRISDLLHDGTALAIASHDLDLVAEVADRVVVLRAGRVVHDGDVTEGLALHTAG